MKAVARALSLILPLVSCLAAGAPARAEVLSEPLPATGATAAPGPAATATSIRIEEPARGGSPLSDQSLSLALAPFAPESVLLSNGSYHFDYGSRPASLQAQVGWALKIFELASGGFYFQETLAFSALTGDAVQGTGSDLTSASYTVGLLGLDTRLLYAGAWFPWKPLVPFLDAGYRYSIYYQPGSSGLESVEGGVGNPVAGAGLRLWLNRQASLAGGVPVFVTGKVDRIFPQTHGVNLASTSIYGGITLGL